jgi:hypothetical protein
MRGEGGCCNERTGEVDFPDSASPLTGDYRRPENGDYRRRRTENGDYRRNENGDYRDPRTVTIGERTTVTIGGSCGCHTRISSFQQLGPGRSIMVAMLIASPHSLSLLSLSLSHTGLSLSLSLSLSHSHNHAVTMAQLRIDSYFLRSSSSSSTASTVIEIDSKAPTDDEQPPAAASPHRGSAKKRRASSTATSRRRSRKRRSAAAAASSQLPIDSYFLSPAARSSSAPTAIDITGVDADDNWDVWLSEDDTMSLSQLAARRAERTAARHAVPGRAQSVAAPQPVVHRSQPEPVVRRALSDISNDTDRQREWHRKEYEEQRSFYKEVRARFAHPADRTKCAYCGVQKHSALHHEEGFERAGAEVSFHCSLSQCIALTGHSALSLSTSVLHCFLQIRSPCTLKPDRLAAEIERCTREDGTVGLASVCGICHRKAARKTQYLSSEKNQKAIARNRELDSAAKVARGKCECDDEHCRLPVTEKTVDLFEWDHLVQSFDDPDYRTVSALVGGGVSAERCDKERTKCRLLYIECHQAHSAKQTSERAAWRRAQQR